MATKINQTNRKQFRSDNQYVKKDHVHCNFLYLNRFNLICLSKLNYNLMPQVEVPDRKSICPDRNERTRWRRAFKITRSGKENERTIVWTYAILNAR